MGLRGKPKPKRPPVFGEKGTVGIAYLGRLPLQHRGCYTGKLYVWNEQHKNLWADKRDVPGMVDEYGRELLDGVPDRPKREKRLVEKEPESELEQAERPEVKDEL